MIKVVFVHGFLGSSFNWAPVLSKLSTPLGLLGLSCQSVDLLWHGRRPGPLDPEKLTLETMALDMIAQMQLSENDQVIGVGHSFGLRPLLWASKLRPEIFKGLIVEDSSPELSQRGFDLLGKVFKEIPVPFESRESAKSFLEEKFGKESQMARFLLANMLPDNSGRQTWRFQALPLQKLLEESFSVGLWGEWENFPQPIHMILGENSHFVTPERLEKCLSLGAQFGRSHHSIPQAAHWVHADNLEGFCEDLLIQVEKWI